VSDLLRNRLHWLRVPQRIQFKLCLLMYKALHGMAPDYLRQSVSEDDARGSLRSAERVPRAATKLGDRAFAISVPLMWNSLPTTVRNSNTLSNFKSALKSHLFTSLFSRLHQQLRSVTAPLNRFTCYGAIEIIVVLLLFTILGAVSMALKSQFPKYVTPANHNSMTFQAWKMWLLNSRTFHGFPGSIRTLFCW